MSSETIKGSHDAEVTTDWDSLTHAEGDPTVEPGISEPEKPADESHEATAEEPKSFNEQELERIGRLTGRVPDDPEVIKLNLVLRYQKFQQYRALYDGQKAKHIMIQRETYEDIATAKRELEEAMYLYDETFKKRDDEIDRLTEEQHRHDVKDQLRPDKHFSAGNPDDEGRSSTGTSWVKARLERKKVYDEKRGHVDESRQAAADRLYEELGKMSEDIKEDEIFLTYDLYKDREPEGSIAGRRDGFEAGKKGLFDAPVGGSTNPGLPVDWALYPHAPKAGEEPTAESTEDGGAGDDSGEGTGEGTGAKGGKSGEGDKDDSEVTGAGSDEEKARMIELEKERALREKIESMTEAERDARLKELLEEKKRHEETLAKVDSLLEEYDELEAEKEAIDAALEADMETPLVAISADFSLDKKDLAHDLAERQLNEETSRAGMLKRLWKGTLFRKYYELKYTDELMEGERTVDVDGRELSVDDLIAGRKDAAISRFVLGVVEESDDYIHSKAGEKLVEADPETSKGIKSAIEAFATAKIPEGGSLEDLKRNFMNEMKRLKAESRDRGDTTDELIFDNYLDVALQARMRVEHGIAMEDVMEGFKVYNAEVRDGIRTEAHRDCVDKIINKLESSNAAGLVPAEVFAIAFGVAASLTQTGARAIGGAGVGMGVSTLISGLRERNRITEGRARMLRDVANGMTYEGTSGDKPKNAHARYEQRIGGTLYSTEKATTLASNIEKAMEAEGEEKSEATLRAIAEARVRIDFSDAERKDLIAYSSEDARGKERLALDIATIRAEKSLSDADKAKLAAMKAEIEKEITSSVDEKDADFRHDRAVMAARKAGKTLILGATVFLASQEVMAVMDPGKIGVLEKYGIFEKLGFKAPANADNASETLIASGFGFNRGGTYTTDPITLRSDQQVEIDRLRANGYTETQISAPTTTTTTTLQEVSPSASTHQIRAAYDGWANNGTSYSDGNELGLHMGNGNLFTRMGGTSTMNGQSLDVDSLTATGQVKGFITIGGAKFEVAPVSTANGLSWGENGVFTTTTGETIQGIVNGQPLYQYFEVAVDNGVDADGLTHIIPLATHVGSNSFNGTISQVVETTTTEPGLIQFIKTISTGARAITTEGIAFAPETARTGLGGPTAPKSTAAPTGGSGAPSAPSGAPTGAPAEEAPAEEEPEEEPEEESTEGSSAGEPATSSATGEAPAEGEPEKTGEEDEDKEPESSASKDLWDTVMENAEGVPPEVLEWLKEPDRIRSDIEDSEDAKKYSEWWDAQGESTKQAVGRVVNLIFKANKESLFDGGSVISDFGDSFMNWMRMNHGGYLS